MSANNCPDCHDSSRRTFLKNTAALSVAAVAGSRLLADEAPKADSETLVTNLFKTPVYGQNQAPSTGRVIGANDRIVVAFIGAGAQGTAHVHSQKAHAAKAYQNARNSSAGKIASSVAFGLT